MAKKAPKWLVSVELIHTSWGCQSLERQGRHLTLVLDTPPQEWWRNEEFKELYPDEDYDMCLFHFVYEFEE